MYRVADDHLLWNNSLTLLVVDPTILVLLEYPGIRHTKHLPSPKNRRKDRYKSLASFPLPKKMKTRKLAAMGIQRSKKACPYVGILTIVLHREPVWSLLQE